MWAAKNKDNSLMLFPDLGSVTRGIDEWVFTSFSSLDYKEMWKGSKIESSKFIDLKWEDEPIRVELFNIDKLCERVSKIVTEYDDNCHPSKEHIKRLLSI